MKTNVDNIPINFKEYSQLYDLADCTPKDIWNDSQLHTINEVCKLIFPLYTDEEIARATYEGTKDDFLFTMVPLGLLQNELQIRGYYDKANASSRN